MTCSAPRPHWRLLQAEGRRAAGAGAVEDWGKAPGSLCLILAPIYSLAADRV